MLEDYQTEDYEVWRDIKDTNGKYQVSDWGNVRNVKSGECLMPALTNSGFLMVSLCISPEKNSVKNVHILVAQTFIPNPYNLREIAHVDGDSFNNHMDNLMWQSTHDRLSWKKEVRNIVVKCDLRGNEIKRYMLGVEEILDEMKISKDRRVTVGASIRNCCKGNQQVFRGYKWRYITKSKKYSDYD